MELDRTNQDQKEVLETRFETYPTPPVLPPVTMLAASICGIQDREIPKAEMLQILRTEGWKAAFLAGSRSEAVGKVNNKVISKA
jgi:hypothetical protein